MTSPPSWQPKQWKKPRDGVTLNDGLFSSWNGHSPLSEPPPALRSVTWAATTSSIRDRSRTSAMSSSRIRPATRRVYAVDRQPRNARPHGRQRDRPGPRAACRLTADGSVSDATWSTTTRRRAASSSAAARSRRGTPARACRIARLPDRLDELGEQLALARRARSTRSSAFITRCAAIPLSTAISARRRPAPGCRRHTGRAARQAGARDGLLDAAAEPVDELAGQVLQAGQLRGGSRRTPPRPAVEPAAAASNAASSSSVDWSGRYQSRTVAQIVAQAWVGRARSARSGRRRCRPRRRARCRRRRRRSP